MIIQGTTPTHTFSLPFDTSIVKAARFVYIQDDEVMIVKAGEDVMMDGLKVATTLTQEDTFALTPDVEVVLILRVLTMGGDALASDKQRFRCRGLADKEVMA